MRIGIAGPVSLDLLRSRLPIDPPPTYAFPLISHLVNGLLERGHQVDLFALSSDVPSPLRIQGDGLTLHIGRYRRRRRAADFFRRERADLLAAMTAATCDVIHAHWTYEFALAALASGKPTIVTAHDAPFRILRLLPTPYRACRFLMAVRVLHQVSTLTAVSPYVATHLGGILRSGVCPVVIPNGIPERIFQTARAKYSERTQSLRYATVLTGWGKIKNAASLLRAFAIVRRSDPGATLRLFGAGHGANEEAFHWALEHQLTAGVHFVGSVPNPVLLEALSNDVDVLVHPAIEESYGMAVAEAMALGIPVIAGERSGAVPWTLDRGRCGLLIDITNVAALADTMISLGRNPTERLRLRTVAMEHAVAHYHLDRVLDAYEKQYDHVLRAATSIPSPNPPSL